MKLKNSAGEALCPVCALNGEVMPLQSAINSLEIICMRGHKFDRVALSALASLGRKAVNEKLNN